MKKKKKLQTLHYVLKLIIPFKKRMFYFINISVNALIDLSKPKDRSVRLTVAIVRNKI